MSKNRVRARIRRHPMQPVEFDRQGVARFKPNAIIRFLLKQGLFDLNRIADMSFPDEDRAQLAQLIGYSVGGFADLSYVSPRLARQAQGRADRLPAIATASSPESAAETSAGDPA